MNTAGLTLAPDAELVVASTMAEQATLHLRDVLGTVAPRDPKDRRLGERRYRLDLLHELLEPGTFGYAAQWLAAMPAVQTKRDYADDLRHWARVAAELAGEEPFELGAITGDVIVMWRQWTEVQRYSPRTVNRRLSSLASLIEYVKYKTRLPIVSPITRYDRPKVDRHDETTATPILEVEEFQALVDAAGSAREALVPVLIYTLAGRVSECCRAGLHQMDSDGEECKLDLTRKGGKGRVFTLPMRLCELQDVANAGRTDGPLLVDDAGNALDRFAVDRLLNRLGRKAGVLSGRETTPHMLRASRLTHMYDAKVPIGEIQKYADHANIETTMGYIRRRDDDKLKARHARAAVAVYDHLVDRWVA